MDPFKNQVDDRTSYSDLDDQFREARLDRGDIDQGDWPSQIDRAAMDVAYGVALGTTGSAFDHGATIGRNDFGTACGNYYVDGLRSLAGEQSDLPRLISEYDPEDLGDLAFRLNELRVELSKLGLTDTEIGNLNRATEALVEKIITQRARDELNRQSLHQPEAVADLLYQLFSDPAVTTYADVLIEAISTGSGASVAGSSLLEHLDRPQMVTLLWEHQKEAIKNWVTDAGTAGYVNMATATGKTVLGLAGIAHLFGDLHPADASDIPDVELQTSGQVRVLIVAGQDLLLEQWQSEFDEHLNIPRSRTVAAQDDERIIELSWGQIEFRTAQDLLNETDQFNYDLVILDEAHRYSSGTRDSQGWRDLFEELTDSAGGILAMSGSIDDEWLGDASIKDALEENLTQCIEFTIEKARKRNVIADFRWDICYAASTTGETLAGVADSTETLRSAYNTQQHKFEPHALSDDIPPAIPDQFETLRDLRSFAHTKEGKQARDNSEQFDSFATAAFSRRPKRWQLNPPAETIGDLLAEHLPDRKTVVLVQSYAQAETIGEELRDRYGDELVFVPQRDEEAPYDTITQFKTADQAVLVGPGEVFGVGVDLPNADVAINLAKGGVNASLIQRIGRILRNPTGDKQAHFYQIVTVPATSQARLPGEDGRRLLRRASEFRALGSRFREYPGFVVTDEETSEIIHELETAGTMAKIMDERETGEIVDDDVARELLDEITAEIDDTDSDQHSQPVLTTHWKPESLAAGTIPVQEFVEESNTSNGEEPDTAADNEPASAEGDTASETSPTADRTSKQLAVEVTDDEGTAIENAAVVLEGSAVIEEKVTDSDGYASIPIEPVDGNETLSVVASRAGFETHIVSISSAEPGETVKIELQRQSIRTSADLFGEATPDTEDGSRADTPDGDQIDERVREEIQQVRNELTGDSKSSESSDNDDAISPRQELVAELQRIDDSTEGYPLTTELHSKSDFTPDQYYQEFGSWETALEAAGIDKEQRLIEDILRVAIMVEGYPTTIQIDQYGVHSSGVHTNHFGSWDAALEAAGVEHTDTGDQDTERERAQATTQATQNDSENDSPIQNESDSSNEGPSPGELIDELQRLDKETDGYPLTTQARSRGQYDPEQYYAEFGSWDDALRAAGIDKGQRLIDEIHRVANIVEDRPTTTEMNEHGAISSGTYSNYFGSWADALDAAETQQNLEEIIDDQPSDSADESTQKTTDSSTTSAAESSTSEESSDLVANLMDDLEDDL